MIFSVLMSLLLVGSLALIDCPAGEEDKDAGGACVACANGFFKAAKGTTACDDKGTAKNSTECDALQRALGANSDAEKTINDRECGACKLGYSTAKDAAAGATCALNCAAGFGGATCQACNAGVDFNDDISLATATCKAKKACAKGEKDAATKTTNAVCNPCLGTEHTTDDGTTCVGNTELCANKDTTPFLPIAATTTSDKICGCAAGSLGADCLLVCPEGKFLAAGDNVSKVDAANDCATWTACTHGVKAKGTTGTDNECFADKAAADKAAADQVAADKAAAKAALDDQTAAKAACTGPAKKPECGGCAASNDVCSSCAIGFYDSSKDGDFTGCTNACDKTLTNCSECSTKTSCSACAAGHGLAGDPKTCTVACGAGCATCSADAVCLSCKEGFGTKAATCTACSDTNCKTCEAHATCTACKTGFEKGTGDAAKCTATAPASSAAALAFPVLALMAMLF